ncbi:MAG: hypothetical protein PVF15_04605 [Candidatus Bathyarchaeota archaeon]|jgi:hypothetical protein
MENTRRNKGQFIVIAALMISILIVSIGVIMYGSVTYFRHERWEEYLSLIDTLKISSHRVVAISLANYTLSMNENALKDNLNKWRINITRAYGGSGIVLYPELAEGPHQIYNLTINYSQGLSSNWHSNVSFSAANVTLQMNITSIGLTGYKFISTLLVREEILSAVYDNPNNILTVKLALDKEDLIPITDLPKSSFSLNINLNGQWQSSNFSLSQYYDSTPSIGRFIFELQSDNISSQPSDVSVAVTEARNIKVVSNCTVT